jgi:lysozyme family protein
MSTDGFDAALSFVLAWEGGLSDDPADPGGRTNRGITQQEYSRWLAGQGLDQTLDVANMDDTQMEAIYQSDYWIPAHCPELPSKDDLLQFDTAVNMGVGRAIRFLQQAAGAPVDGVFGTQTLQAVQNANPAQLVSMYCDARESFYRALAQRDTSLAKFLPGWLNRLNSLRYQLGIPGVAKPQAERQPSAPRAKIPDYPAFEP